MKERRDHSIPCCTVCFQCRCFVLYSIPFFLKTDIKSKFLAKYPHVLLSIPSKFIIAIVEIDRPQFLCIIVSFVFIRVLWRKPFASCSDKSRVCSDIISTAVETDYTQKHTNNLRLCHPLYLKFKITAIPTVWWNSEQKAKYNDPSPLCQSLYFTALLANKFAYPCYLPNVMFDTTAKKSKSMGFWMTFWFLHWRQDTQHQSAHHDQANLCCMFLHQRH